MTDTPCLVYYLRGFPLLPFCFLSRNFAFTTNFVLLYEANRSLAVLKDRSMFCG